MNFQVRMKLLKRAIFLILVAGVCFSVLPSRAADECLSQPNSNAPQGSHWYYRVDRTNQRQCWYLGAERAKPRPQQQQSASASPPPPASKPAERPAPQTATPAPQTTTEVAAIPVKTTVIRVSAADDAILRPAFLETSGWGRADESADESLISTKRSDQHSVTVTDDAQPGRPIVAASEAAKSEKPSLFSNVFVHLVALLAAVLAIVAVIGRIIFRLSPIRPADRVKPGAERASERASDLEPFSSRQTRDAQIRQRNRSNPRRPDLSRDETGNAAVVADIEQSVQRLLHELRNRHLRLHGQDLERT
jgi:hypothetical protein